MFNLKNVTVLTKAQQKNVRGGKLVCAYALSDFGPLVGCADTAAEAEKESNGGYWCCNSADAYDFCK